MDEDNYSSYESDDVESDEEMCMLRKALDVKLPADFDPNHVPQNGEEYIQYVMYEAKQCKKLVVAKIDEAKVKNEIFTVEVREECIKPPTSMQATTAWQEERAEDFHNLNKYLNKKLTKCERNRNIQENHMRSLVTSSVPTVTEMNKFAQYDKLRLLQIILDEMGKIKQGESLSYNLGIWIYSILVTLDVPLCPEFVHTLRELARKCSVIRSKLSENSSDFIQLNLIICIIGRCFKQFDLIDNTCDGNVC